ncbi:MAG: hypothetical protein JWN78_1337 [Bacteroidota bacterium]|nr:hypothetical protein [Bacteroidota bacterium]
MIQRIQSVYLFLAALAAIVFLFVSFGKIQMNGSIIIMKGMMRDDFSFLCGVISAVSFLSIFLFNKRKVQMKTVLLSILLSFGLIGLSVYAIVLHQKDHYQFGPAVIFPLFVLIFNFLAYKGIKHDENLVKSMDRLR